jgi:hypothetical protein
MGTLFFVKLIRGGTNFESDPTRARHATFQIYFYFLPDHFLNTVILLVVSFLHMFLSSSFP